MLCIQGLSTSADCSAMLVLQKRGNVIKVDRHKYVKVAYHGFRLLSREERAVHYNHSAVRDDYEEPNYGMIDTLFSLAEAYLFMQLVELAVSLDWLAYRLAGCVHSCKGHHNLWLHLVDCGSLLQLS